MNKKGRNHSLPRLKKGKERDDSTRNRNAFDIYRQHPTTIASARKNKRNKTRGRDRAGFFFLCWVGCRLKTTTTRSIGIISRPAFSIPSTMMGNHPGQVHFEFDLLLTSTPAPSFRVQTTHTHTQKLYILQKLVIKLRTCSRSRLNP